MKWLKNILGNDHKELFVHRLRREFEFLESEYGYHCECVQNPEAGEEHDGYYVVTYINSAIRRSVQAAAPATMKRNVTIILYCDSNPDKVPIRDVQKYLPAKQLKAFYAPDQYNSSDYIGQIVGMDKVIHNYKTVLFECTNLLDGSTWPDRAEFDRKLFETGKFRYSSSAELFAFIDQSRVAFEYLVKEFGYTVVFATDQIPPYIINKTSEHIDFGNKRLNSYISVEYDLREEHFGIKLYDYEKGLKSNLEYELFNPLDMKNRQGYGFLKEAADKLRERLNKFQ